MTVVASVAARDMCRILAGCYEAVMTRPTATHDLRMVYGVHRRKHVAVMAVFTDVGGLNMCWILASRVRAVVAAHTIASDIDVIEVRRYPTRGRMTVVAVVAAVNVCQGLAGRRDAVMTGAAGAHYLRVVNGKHRREHIGVVAIFTDIAGLDMGWPFARSFYAVVATRAVTCDVHMVEIRR